MANGRNAGSSVGSKPPVIRSLLSKLYPTSQLDNVVSISKDDGQEIRSPSALNFRIFPANGGYIVEFYRYDTKRDETSTKLYVIPSSEELTETISSICQQEFLQL